MQYLYIIIVIILLVLIYMRYEATWLKIENLRFTKDKNGLKIIHMSDIHIGKLRVSYEKIRNVISQEKPDIIIISGDYIESEKDIPEFLKFIDYIKGITDIYLCLGNHDIEAYKDDKKGLNRFKNIIKSKGLNLLHNESACIEKNSKKYNLIGIADIRYGHHDIKSALSSCNKDAFMNIAFSHNPDIVLQFPRSKVDYLLCGHFHGGQIWAPFNLEFTILRREKLCRMGIRKGLHKVNGINLYINRGLGNVVVPLRFFSRPEITVIYFP